MNHWMTVLLCAALLCLTTASQSDDHGKMTSEERAKLISYVVASEKETLAAIDQLTEAQWKFKSAPERWSIGEVAEHILLAEGLLYGVMERALATPANAEWAEKTRGKTEFIENVMVKRLGKAQAPESIVPSGKISRDEFIKRYREARAKTLKFAETTERSLKNHTLDHPFPVFGTLNAYQWLIYIPLHNIRHNQQIAEVKTQAGYPAR
jgi:uncharacterized damage-inducible protein DinB